MKTAGHRSTAEVGKQAPRAASPVPIGTTDPTPLDLEHLDGRSLSRLQREAGNVAATAVVEANRNMAVAERQSPSAETAAPVIQRFFPNLRKLFGESLIAGLASAGRTREASALTNLMSYAKLHGAKGPLGDDTGFDKRLVGAIFKLATQVRSHPSFDKLPARLKALIFTAEKLNLSPIKAGTVADKDREWMTSREGALGAKNPAVKGSTGAFGETAWKCNKLVADAYLAKAGGAIGKRKYPFYGKDQKWSFKASDLAAKVWRGVVQLVSGKEFKHFPYSELMHLAKDGSTVIEIDEFDAKGSRTARYVLNGGVFEKHVPDGKGWKKTKETRDPKDLQPGSMADIGDIVAFHSAEKGVSGHTGLNLGNDLFISAMNATEGVGVLSISLHLNPGAWDKYDYVGFRRFKD